ncbi:MAG: serine hydrolase [Pseudomonadales bacterium]|nr:serine hydrolase [Pseudomonadales bacterium]
MLNRVSSISAFVLLSFCAFQISAESLPEAPPEKVGMSSERLGRIAIVMRKHIDAGNIQGAVTAVARHGKVVHFESHGSMDEATGKPMAKDAMFIMMSSTKPILAVAAMMMIEEGLIRPSDPVSKYIPEFGDMQVAVLKDPADENISPYQVARDNVPAHRTVPLETPITIQHILTHTSGILSGGIGSAVAERIPRDTLASYIPKVANTLLDFQPGARWAYSPGTGLDVVARIIEIVSNTPYDEFVQTRIFEPLGMKDTYYNVPADKDSRRVNITDRDMARFRQPTKYFSGSYGLTSTAEDYLRFEQMLINGGELFGNRLLSPRSVTMMGSNHLGDMYRGFSQKDKGQGYGYTVSVLLDPIAANSRRSAGAFGWGGAFGTRSWTDPEEGITGVLMLQQPNRDAQYDFENAVRQAIIE